jgi:SAM-dependent methyltransferase
MGDGVEFASLDNMRRCIKRHVLTDEALMGRPLRILDVGGADVNGTYRDLFAAPGWSYTSADLDEDPSVDVVLTDPDHLPFDDGSYDVVITGSTFEHAPTFWRLFAEMMRVCATDGVAVVIAPSAGPIHRFPVDCYRFLPDAYQALADEVGVHLVDWWRDERGPFHELVGVFRRTPTSRAREVDAPSFVPGVDGVLQNFTPAEEVAEHEVAGGVLPTSTFLKMVHRELQPRFYLEIGVEYGRSLAMAACPAIGIDPAPDLKVELGSEHRVHLGLSQDFFADEAATAGLGPLDLAYIDGMHLLENALLDFMYVERHAHPASVLIVDDIYPNHPQQALRVRSSRHWTGDVWKIMAIFQLARPDLVLLPIDTSPSGTLVVLGADPTSRVLWDGFGLILTEAASRSERPGPNILERRQALDPSDPIIPRVLGMMADARDASDVHGAVDRVRRILAGAFPRKVVSS